MHDLPHYVKVPTYPTLDQQQAMSGVLVLRQAGPKDVDPTLRAALLDSDTGLMRAGALPKVSTANAAGAKAVLEGTEKASPCLVHMFPIENRPSNESIFSHASYKVVEI